MLKHIVMYKLKDCSNENALKLRDVFLSMKGKIDVLEDISVGIDCVRSERSYDVVLECIFKGEEELKSYLIHPVHLPVKDYVHQAIVKSHSVDYIY